MTSEQELKYRDTLARASVRIRELMAQVNELKGRGRIAVVGIGCRFPGGADSPEAFWDLLQQGVDAVGEIPAERWNPADWYDPDPSAAGKSYTKSGAFLRLDALKRFDAAAFDISPFEAASLDPQQRLLLETSREAVERSGADPKALAGSRTGVFVGVCGSDYAQGGLLCGDTAAINPYSITGVLPSIAAGRISYLLDLQGPSISLDTACSSSLIAILLAMKSLLTGECDAALAGGVNLILTPGLYVGLSRMNALSPDGCCRAFGDGANGYVRGEGCGILYLKRLEDAELFGEPIVAVLRGGAMNHDGRSNGLTAPNSLSQQEVIRNALNQAGMTAAEIDAVETHGTGTPLGDPIEARSLAELFGCKQELPIGSVKTNIGHLEIAAGVAGAIKAILMVNCSYLPPSLHAGQLNSHIPWDRIPVKVVQELRPFPETGGLRTVGVNSFGFSGTNAHLIVQEYRRSDGSNFPLSLHTPRPLQGTVHWNDPLALYGRSGLQAEHATSGHAPDLTPDRPNAAGAVTAAEILLTIVQMVTTVAGREAEGLDPDANLFELGLDSLMLIQLRDTLNREYGVTLELANLMEEANSLTRLAAFVAARIPAIPAPAARQEQQAILTGSGHQHAAPSGERRKFNLRATILEDESGRLTVQQREFVAHLIAGHTARSAKSKEVAQRHRRYLSDWINTLAFRGCLKELVYPIASMSSSGSRFIDLDGNEYIDLAMGFGVAFFGHAPDFVTKAVQERLRRGMELATQIPEAGEAAAIFCRLTGMERVTFCNTGSEAVMMALRIARTVTGRDRIVLFAGSYHGTTDGVQAFSDDSGRVFPTTPGVTEGAIGTVHVLPYGTDEALAAIRSMAGELAAILVEPVQSRRPGFHPVAFLQELRKIADKSGAALIFDEMITGFRTHPGGAQALFGVRADIGTYGKAVGGGMPISMVAGSARFMDAVDGGYWQYGDDSKPEAEVMFFGGTFCRHPLAIASSLAALRHMEEQGATLQEEVNRKTGRLAAELNSFFARERVPMLVQHFGSLFRFESYGQYALLLQPLEMDLFFYLLMKRGIFTWERRICFFSTAHSDADLDRIITAVKESISELRAGGFPFEGAPPELQPQPRLLPEGVGENSSSLGSDVFPMASAQRRLYILSQYEEGEGPYHLSGSVRVHGPLDLDRVQSAFRELATRHETLRTGFDMLHGELVQTVHQEPSLAITRLELPEEAAGGAIAAFITPFDLSAPPLLRILTVRTGPERHILVLDSHHIALDGFSLNILISEFMRLYAGEELGAPPLQYRHYVQMQQRYLASAAAVLDERFWLDKLSGKLPLLQLPGDFSRPAEFRFAGEIVRGSYDRELTAALKNGAARNGTTLFMFMLAAFALLLRRLSGQDDLMVGVPVSSRETQSLNIVGMFANTLPLRIAADGATRFDTFLKELSRETFVAFEHQHYPFELMVDKLNLPVDTSRNPIFDVCFSFENADERGMRIRDLEAEQYELPRSVCMFDLAMEVIEQQGTLRVSFEFPVSLFRKERVAGWEKGYRSILQELLEHPTRPISDIGTAAITPADRPAAPERAQPSAAPLPTADELRRFLASRLPSHMIPSSIHLLDRIPLTANGKVDSRALLASRHSGAAAADLELPENGLEQQLAKIWEELLGVKGIGRHDSFFTVGGQSLKAVRAVSRIQKELGIGIRLKDIFANPTIAGLAKLAGQMQPVVAAIPRLGDAPRYRLSHAQKRLWLLDQTSRGAASYNMSGSWLIEGWLNVAALQHAFELIAGRHESFRTSFVLWEGEPWQVVVPQVSVPIVEMDLTSDPQAESRARELARQEGTARFDLTAAPLVRLLLIRLPSGADGTERSVLVVTMHHIIGDGWSIGILLAETARLYAGDAPDSLPQLQVRYRDYSAWHNSHVAGPVGREDRDYWLSSLAGEIPALELPTDFPRPEVMSGEGGSVALELGPDLARGVKRLAAQHGATLFMTLLAGIKLLLHLRSGQDELLIGAPVAGREHPDLEHQIGFYLNTLALRSKIRPEESFSMLLGSVKKSVEAAFSHQEYPFDLVVEELGLKPAQGRNPLFDVLFVLQNTEPAELCLAGTRVSPFLRGALMSKFDLMIDLVDDATISGNIEYSGDLYNPETVALYGADLKRLLEAAVTDPSLSLSELGLLLAPAHHAAAIRLTEQAVAALSEDF